MDRIDRAHPLLLASASPRRREILASLRVPFVVQAVDADERVLPGEGVRAYLERVVASKLAAAVPFVHGRGVAALLVADTTVVLDGEPLGKPRDPVEAQQMLRALAGREHEVLTRFALARAAAPAVSVAAETVATRVVFRPLTEAQIARYVASGEGRDKAGSYAIQGLGAFLVRRIEGSYPNVVGLPSCEVCEALVATGLVSGFPLEGDEAAA